MVDFEKPLIWVDGGAAKPAEHVGQIATGSFHAIKVAGNMHLVIPSGEAWFGNGHVKNSEEAPVKVPLTLATLPAGRLVARRSSWHAGSQADVTARFSRAVMIVGEHISYKILKEEWLLSSDEGKTWFVPEREVKRGV